MTLEMSKKGCDQLRLSKIQEVTVDKVREIEAKLECRKIRRDN